MQLALCPRGYLGVHEDGSAGQLALGWGKARQEGLREAWWSPWGNFYSENTIIFMNNLLFIS